MAGRSTKHDAARKLAVEAARIAHDDHGEDILVLDLRGISPVTEYFVIATSTSGRQGRAIADEIGRFGKSIGQSPWHVSGGDRGTWILLDFVDVVVHLFEPTMRRHYDLELIWGEAPRVEWRKK